MVGGQEQGSVVFAFIHYLASWGRFAKLVTSGEPGPEGLHSRGSNLGRLLNGYLETPRHLPALQSSPRGAEEGEIIRAESAAA